MLALKMSHDSYNEQSNALLCSGTTQIGQKRKRSTSSDLGDIVSFNVPLRDVLSNAADMKMSSSHFSNELKITTRFVDLPQDIVLVILSYIGPISPTLLSVSQLTRQHSLLMSQLGHSMLLRARSTFRFLLPKTHPQESHMSLSIRHARCYRDIRDKCKTLKTILDKDFIVGCIVDSIPSLETTLDAGNNISAKTRRSSRNINLRGSVTSQEVDIAIHTALELLGAEPDALPCTKDLSLECVKRNPDSFMKRNITKNCSSTLESKILALCGRCGGKVFKYVKMRLWLRSEGVRFHVDSEGKDTQCFDEERMDKARLIMQLVICRDLELSRLQDDNERYHC